MRFGEVALLLALASVWIAPGMMADAQQTASPTYTPGEETPEEFPPGRGREEAFYACVACHNFKLVAGQGLSRERWDETLTFMTERHNMPTIEGADRELILDYLAAAFPERPPTRRGWQNPFQR